MNQVLQQGTRPAIVSLSANAISKARGRGDEERLVCIAEETPVAFRYNGFSHAVMMATPADLEDFAIGFSRSEGIIEGNSDAQNISICQSCEGTTIDISLAGGALHRYLAGRRVRQLRGHTSCGLCGVEDLGDVRRPAPDVPPAKSLSTDSIQSALNALRTWQPLSRYTRCAHASAWVALEGNLCAVREDVGRHNSLDKLIGAILRNGLRADHGFCLITSRCSFEMVQKAITAGFPALVSVGAPTALAIRLAVAAGLTLYSLSRDGEPMRFASPVRSED